MDKDKDEMLLRIVRALRDVIMLHFLSKAPMHGYEINKKLKENFRVEYPSSILYPVLRELEEKGAITSKWVKAGRRKKRMYYITKKGKAALKYAHSAMEKPARECLRNILGE